MKEPRSTATIRALASLAELSADQLASGQSVEDVIVTLRRAAEAVRLVVDKDDELDREDSRERPELSLVDDLTPMDLDPEEEQDAAIAEADEKASNEDDDKDVVLNAS